MWNKMKEKLEAIRRAVMRIGESGQGTSEYAILIGVISIIAVVGVLAFGDQLGALLDTATGHMKTVNDWSYKTS